MFALESNLADKFKQTKTAPVSAEIATVPDMRAKAIRWFAHRFNLPIKIVTTGNKAIDKTATERAKQTDQPKQISHGAEPGSLCGRVFRRCKRCSESHFN